MDEYIKREAALALVRPDAPEDEKAAVTIATAKKLVRSILHRAPAADVEPVVHGKRLLADMSGAKAVSLHDIYRVIAGHSYYHGDSILAALTCIVEGKEVNPVRPADVAPVVYCCHCRSYNKPRLGWCSFHMDRENYDDFCSYGVRMDGDAE